MKILIEVEKRELEEYLKYWEVCHFFYIKCKKQEHMFKKRYVVEFRVGEKNNKVVGRIRDGKTGREIFRATLLSLSFLTKAEIYKYIYGGKYWVKKILRIWQSELPKKPASVLYMMCQEVKKVLDRLKGSYKQLIGMGFSEFARKVSTDWVCLSVHSVLVPNSGPGTCGTHLKYIEIPVVCIDVLFCDSFTTRVMEDYSDKIVDARLLDKIIEKLSELWEKYSRLALQKHLMTVCF